MALSCRHNSLFTTLFNHQRGILVVLYTTGTKVRHLCNPNSDFNIDWAYNLYILKKMNSQASNNIFKKFLTINRKLHIHFGLFLLLFIWLFFVSGLIIHHGEWNFAKFYENRTEKKTAFIIALGYLHDDPDMALRIEALLKIVGEVSNLQVNDGSIDFRVSSPGIVREIHIDPHNGRGIMNEIKYNFWRKLRTLHTFNGMDKTNPSISPNWFITKLWRIMMDVTAILLIILCVGSWIMWYKVRRDYKWGYVLFGLGLAVSGYYMFVLDLL